MSLQKSETALIHVYQRQIATYSRALAFAESLLANWEQISDITSALQPMNAWMEEIRQNNAGAESDKQGWRQAGGQPSPQLASLLQECATVIDNLRDRIRQLEQLAAQRKERLTPELDGLARATRMQRAYAKSGRL